MNAQEAELDERLLAGLGDGAVNVGLGLHDHLLDPGRMNASVLNEPLDRDACHFAANWVEPADDERLRRIVDDEVDATRLLQRPDVAPLAADDASLHLVGREVNRGHGTLLYVLPCVALDGQPDDSLRPSVGFFAGKILDGLALLGGSTSCLVQELFDQLPPDLLAADPGDRFELRALLAHELYRVAAERRCARLFLAGCPSPLCEILLARLEVRLFLECEGFAPLGSLFARCRELGDLIGGSCRLELRELDGLEGPRFGLQLGVPGDPEGRLPCVFQ